MLNLDILGNISKRDAKRYLKNKLYIDQLTEPITILEEMGLTVIQKFSYVKCVNRGDEDFLNLNENQKSCLGRISLIDDEEILLCSDCNRLVNIDNKNIFTGYKLSLNFQAIFKAIQQKLGNNHTRLSDDKSHVVFIDEEEIEHHLCLVDICENISCRTTFYTGNKIMYIACDIVEYVDIPNFLWIYDFLLMDKTILVNYIKIHTISPDQEKMEKSFANHIDNKSWQNFEKIVTDILNSISESSDNYNRGLSILQKYSGTFFSSVTFHMGGSGKPDALSVSILDYYRNIFKPDVTHEFKHSKKSKIHKIAIELKDFRELLVHSIEGDGIIFTNRIRIRGSVIEQCQKFKHKNGYWKYVIINRPLLKLFIYLFAPDFYDAPDKFSGK